MSAELRCSFCHKSQRQVRTLISAPEALICDECVDICAAMPTEREDAPAGDASAIVDHTPSPVAACVLCRMPVPATHLLPIARRGALCPACVDAVDVARAVREQ